MTLIGFYCKVRYTSTMNKENNNKKTHWSWINFILFKNWAWINKLAKQGCRFKMCGVKN